MEQVVTERAHLKCYVNPRQIQQNKRTLREKIRSRVSEMQENHWKARTEE